MPDTGKKILIIDGHSILNRAFYGLPDLTNYEGLHTNAVLGFLNIIFKIIDEENPTNVCVAFDVKQPTFRHLMYKEYKGTRKPMPDELREQVPLIKEVLTAMNVTIVEKGGYEADDIIGTLSRVADSAGYKVVIVSGDRDLLQLATDNILVRIPKTKAGGTTIENYYADDVKDLYGVTPVQFIDMKGLMGDTSDNIPGVPGIGEKTASKIIQQWGSVAGALEHIDEIKPPKAQKNLAEFSEQAIMSRELAAIKLDCELDFKLEDTTYENAFNDNSYNIFKRLEFKSLLKKFDNQQTVSELKPDITVVNSTADFAHIEDAAKKSGAVGVYVAHSDDMMLGIAVACDSKDVYVINCSSGIDPDEAVKFIYDLKNAGIIICMEDLKSALKYVDFHECDTNVLDIGVAAYLLNPMEDSYDYDDVAKEYLGNILPSEKELIGKDELNIFTFISDNFLEVFSYKAVVPLLAKDIVMDKLAKEGNKKAIAFPRAKITDAPDDFSFSGLKSAVLNYLNQCQMKGEEVNRADVAASFQQSVTDVLTEHTVGAAKRLGINKVAIAGGVASNSSLRAQMEEACRKNGIEFYHPSPIFCTDNAAMIGVAGYYEYIKGIRDGWDLNAKPNLKIGER